MTGDATAGAGAFVGGDPARVRAGGAAMDAADRELGEEVGAVRRSAAHGVAGCGGSEVALALARFAAAHAARMEGIAVDVRSLRVLAVSAAEDLAAATGAATGSASAGRAGA